MNQHLLMFACAALAGLSSRPNGGHGVEPEPAEKIGARAVDLAKGTLKALGLDADDLDTTDARAELNELASALDAARKARADDLDEIRRRLGGAEDEPVFAVVDRAAAKLGAALEPTFAHPPQAALLPETERHPPAPPHDETKQHKPKHGR